MGRSDMKRSTLKFSLKIFELKKKSFEGMASTELEPTTFHLQILYLTLYANWLSDVRIVAYKLFKVFLRLVTKGIVSIWSHGIVDNKYLC